MKTVELVRREMDFYSEKGIPFLVVVDFELCCPQIFRLDVLPKGILYDFQGNRNYINGYAKRALPLEPEAIDLSEYAVKFEEAIRELQYGNSFLLNLSTKAKIQRIEDLRTIFYHSKAKYKLLFKNEWLVFSPETFIQVEEGRISTFPMKGTIDADILNAKQIILEDPKEKAEHYTIVDLLRNDLSLVANKVTVDKLRYIDAIRTNNRNLLQVSSKISGTVKESLRGKLGSILFSLLPAGSISGAPKKKTVEIIKKIEGEKRGYYTGIAGIFDGKKFDSTVLIRFIEQTNEATYYRSGGGITHQSILMAEYDEILNKIYVPVH